MLATGTAGLYMSGSWLANHSAGIVRGGLTFGRDQAFDGARMMTSLMDLAGEGLLAVAPLLALTAIGAVAAPVLLGGVMFAPKALEADFSRLSPAAGIGRIFSVASVAELVKSILKTLLIGVVAWWVVAHQQDALFALFGQPLVEGMSAFTRLLLVSILMLVGGIAVIAAMDVPFQLWHYHSRMRMTKEEARQEAKEAEGDPHIKGRIRAQQREMARRRMMSEVPKADVVVTNPTHFAVALKYDGEAMAAPRVVAKGVGLVAQRIREIAEEHAVPRLELPPLARALYHHTDLGAEIPAALYTAVAEVMAYIYQLNQHFTAGAPKPQAPAHVVVPAGLDPGTH
ncbi:MAG: flagellar biosynthesis protein FlhB [Betaproteobacteria bacterium]|nr:flagellar biosynthesis protein FlhB [Betaproteobacteria bacterium]